MSRQKEELYTSLVPIHKLTCRGASTLSPRIEVRQRVHAGIETMKDRVVNLILSPVEAVELARGLIGSLPGNVEVPNGMRNNFELLERYIRLFLTGIREDEATSAAQAVLNPETK